MQKAAMSLLPFLRKKLHALPRSHPWKTLQTDAFILNRRFTHSKNGDLVTEDYPKSIEEGVDEVVRKSIQQVW